MNIFLIFLTVSLLALCAAGLAQSSLARQNILKFVDDIVQPESEIMKDMDSMNMVLSEMNDFAFSTQYAKDLRELFNSFDVHAKSIYKETKYYQNETEAYSIAIPLVCLILFGLIAITVLFVTFSHILHSCIHKLHNKKTGYTFAFFMILIALPFTWVIPGVTVTPTTFLSDMCPTIDEYIRTESRTLSPDAKTQIQYFLYCEGISPFKNLTDYLESNVQKVNDGIKQANASNNQLLLAELLKLKGQLIQIEVLVADLGNCSRTVQAVKNLKYDICILLENNLISITVFTPTISILLIFYFLTVIYFKKKSHTLVTATFYSDLTNINTSIKEERVPLMEQHETKK